MADMRPQGTPRPDFEGRPGHEDSDVSARGIFMFALGLVALGLVIHVALALVMQGFSVRESRAQAGRPPFFAVEVVPPAPRLQGNPGVELMQFKQQDLYQLNHYVWIDRGAGIARIPIDRAMDILARTGLPERTGPPEAVPEQNPPSESEKAPRSNGRSQTKAKPKP
jgi:hypothetical protein